MTCFFDLEGRATVMVSRNYEKAPRAVRPDNTKKIAFENIVPFGLWSDQLRTDREQGPAVS